MAFISINALRWRAYQQEPYPPGGLRKGAHRPRFAVAPLPKDGAASFLLVWLQSPQPGKPILWDRQPPIAASQSRMSWLE